MPVCALWLKASEAIDFTRAVNAQPQPCHHDGICSEAALGIVGHMNAFLPDASQAYVRLADGAEREA